MTVIAVIDSLCRTGLNMHCFLTVYDRFEQNNSSFTSFRQYIPERKSSIRPVYRWVEEKRAEPS